MQRSIEQIVSEIVEATDCYLKIPAVVGYEKPLLDHLYEDYQALGYDAIRSDNIVRVSGNSPESAYLSAHVDRHGIVSIGKGDYRYAAHAIKNYKYDENEAAEALSQLEGICEQFETEHVYAYGRWTGEEITTGSVDHCHYCTKRSNLVFRIKDMEVMPEGIPVAYRHDKLDKGNGYLSGQIDNVMSVGLIYGLFKAGFQGTAIFTTEEEIGKSWKHLSLFFNQQGIETDQLLVLDTSPYDSSEPADSGKVVLRNRDSFGSFNISLVETLKQSATSLDIPIDIKDETLRAQGKKDDQLGRTELGRIIHENKGRWTGATVQIPTFNYHTNKESTTKLAIENVLKLLITNLRI